MPKSITPEEARKCRTGIFGLVARCLKPGLPSEPVIVQYFAHQLDGHGEKKAVFTCHANTYQAFRIDTENVLVSIGGAGYEHKGWTYSAVGEYLVDVVLPLELRCNGVAKKMIGAFRDKLNTAPKLPENTTITVTPGAGSHQWRIESAQDLALDLGLAKTRESVPEQFQVTFAQLLIDATRTRLAGYLEPAQARWEVPTDPAVAALLPPPTQQLQFEQESLF